MTSAERFRVKISPLQSDQRFGVGDLAVASELECFGDRQGNHANILALVLHATAFFDFLICLDIGEKQVKPFGELSSTAGDDTAGA